MLQPMPSLEAMRAELPLKLAAHLSQLGTIPDTIAVRNETMAALLSPLAAELDIEIIQSRVLPAVDRALEFMMRMSLF
jgi:hypothetical protein